MAKFSRWMRAATVFEHGQVCVRIRMKWWYWLDPVFWFELRRFRRAWNEALKGRMQGPGVIGTSLPLSPGGDQ